MFFVNTRSPHAALRGDRGRRAREFKAQWTFSVSISMALFLSRSGSKACIYVTGWHIMRKRLREVPNFNYREGGGQVSASIGNNSHLECK